jgi:hypothetical protein
MQKKIFLCSLKHTSVEFCHGVKEDLSGVYTRNKTVDIVAIIGSGNVKK